MAMIIGIIAVFAVLWGIDRMLTKKNRPETPPELPAQTDHTVLPAQTDHTDTPKVLAVSETPKVPGPPKAMPAAENDDAEVAAAIAAALACYGYHSDHIVAVIAAALVCYGYRPNQIVAVRPAGGTDWVKWSRIEAVSVRNKMF